MKTSIEEAFVLENLELSKNIYRYILDILPKHQKYQKMTYQDKFLIIKSIPEYTKFVEYFPIVVREMIFHFYHDKAFKKFIRFIFNYNPSPEERVKLTSRDKLMKMSILNSKNAMYVYYLHYYTTNKKSKEASMKYYESYVEELNKDSELHYKDYLDILEQSKKSKEDIKERYKREIIKELINK